MRTRIAGPEDYVHLEKSTSVGIWIADLAYTNARNVSYNFPIGAASVACFAEKNLGLAQPIRIFKNPGVFAKALEEDGIPEIVGFSSFVWSSELSLAHARVIKAHAPETITVFGGPHYALTAPEQEAYLREHPEIDFYIPKEGELAFSNLIATLINNDLEVDSVGDSLLSVHSIGRDGTAHITGPLPRLGDLTEIPSPYTTGKMDDFFDGELLPIIQTNRGCPFKCTFCDEGVEYYNKVNRHAQWQIDEEIEYIAKKMKVVREQGGRNDLRIADSNFGMYKQDLDTCRTLRRCQDEYGWPGDIITDTGKNKRERVIEASEIVNHVMRMTGSVQSLTPEVMVNIKRDNISSGALIDIALEAAERDVSSRCELILALPGETRASHFQSMASIIESGFNHVITYQLGILPGSEMFTPESKKRFGMKSRFRVMADCIGSFEVLGEKIICGELEEICMATDAMSFEDYVACRKMALIVSVFYNNFSLQTNSRTSQPLFRSVLKFLRAQQVPVSRWMELMFEEEMTGDLGEVFESYEKATAEELWAEPEEVKQFVQQPLVVERYLSGELGYNILHSFRLVVQTRFVAALSEFAGTTLEKLLREVGKDGRENLEFVRDALAFDTHRVMNIATDIDSTPELTLRNDVWAFLEDDQPSPLKSYALPEPRTLRFVLSEEQRAALARSIQQEGEDKLAGVGNTIVSNHIGREKSAMLLRTPAA